VDAPCFKFLLTHEAFYIYECLLSQLWMKSLVFTRETCLTAIFFFFNRCDFIARDIIGDDSGRQWTHRDSNSVDSWGIHTYGCHMYICEWHDWVPLIDIWVPFLSTWVPLVHINESHVWALGATCIYMSATSSLILFAWVSAIVHIYEWLDW